MIYLKTCYDFHVACIEYVLFRKVSDYSVICGGITFYCFFIYL